jgi:sarcosine oxidase
MIRQRGNAMASNSYDAIVVGLGAMGSAATYHLAKRGQRVLGLEMFQPGHDQGSSHGYHRMIRMSSLQDDGYVPLGRRALELWRELQQEADRNLVNMIGEVRLAQGDERRRAAAEELRRKGFLEILSEAELAERFPGFRLHGDMFATYEADAGFIWSERGIVTHVEQAERHGATVHHSEEVTGWVADGDGVRVTTTRGDYRADHLVLTAGPWAAELLGDLDLPIQVNRTVNGYFEPARPDWWQVEHGAPDFLLDVPEGSFYGIPAVEGVGLKLGLSGAREHAPTTARTIRRTIDDAEIELVRDVLDKYMVGAAGAEWKRITCMCTYTIDDNFIIDRHPAYPQVLFGCGFSGRGFKFAPVVGEIMAELAIDGRTRHDIGFLSADRFSQAASVD